MRDGREDCGRTGTPDESILVTGQLSCCALCEQGFWWGWTTYRIAYGPNHCTVTHWIPAWILEPVPSKAE